MLLAGAADDASAGGLADLRRRGRRRPTRRRGSLRTRAGRRLRGARGDGRRAGVPAHRRGVLARSATPVAAGEATCHVAVAPDGASLIAELLGRRPGRADDAGCRGPAILAGHRRRGRRPLRRRRRGLRRPSRRRRVTSISPRRPARCAPPPGAEFAHLVPSYDEDPRDAVDTASDLRPSRAHQSLFLPGGLIATTDMGLDLVRFWRSDRSGLRQVQQVVLPFGSGPRHMVHHPSGHLYVVAELSCEVFVLAPDVDRSVAPRRRHAARRGHPSGRHGRRAGDLARRRVPLRGRAREQHASRRCGCAAPASRCHRSRSSSPESTGRATMSSCATPCSSPASCRTRSPRSRSTCAPACPGACATAPRRRRRPACCPLVAGSARVPLQLRVLSWNRICLMISRIDAVIGIATSAPSSPAACRRRARR